jgi:hypothetical protein
MDSPHILKNADFSPKTIRNLIQQGEEKTLEHLKDLDEDSKESLKLV